MAATGGSAGLSYAIIGGNADGWFAIAPGTGTISLTAAGASSLANNFERTANAHMLTIQVSDGFAVISITAILEETNVIDPAPVITGPSGRRRRGLVGGFGQ